MLDEAMYVLFFSKGDYDDIYIYNKYYTYRRAINRVRDDSCVMRLFYCDCLA